MDFWLLRTQILKPLKEFDVLKDYGNRVAWRIKLFTAHYKNWKFRICISWNHIMNCSNSANVFMNLQLFKGCTSQVWKYLFIYFFFKFCLKVIQSYNWKYLIFVFKTGETYDIWKNIPSWFRQILVHITYLSRIVFSRWFMHCDHRRLLLRYLLGLESQAGLALL